MGSTLGYLWFIGGPTGRLEMEKLEAAVGARKYSGRYLR